MLQLPKDKYIGMIFHWNLNGKELINQANSCKHREDVQLSFKYMPNKHANILEAGSGLSGTIKYFYDIGYTNVTGVEINKTAVDYLNRVHPELNIVCTDIRNMPFPKNYFDVVLSYGVIEHFLRSPQAPVDAMYDALKPGGIGIITIPCHNLLFRIKNTLEYLDIRTNNFIRKLFRKKTIPKESFRYPWNRYWMGRFMESGYEKFREYRFTPRQFKEICLNAGFEIIESIPQQHMQSKYCNKIIQKILLKFPFTHNHKHACVVKKPITEE